MNQNLKGYFIFSPHPSSLKTSHFNFISRLVMKYHTTAAINARSDQS